MSLAKAKGAPGGGKKRLENDFTELSVTERIGETPQLSEESKETTDQQLTRRWDHSETDRPRKLTS